MWQNVQGRNRERHQSRIGVDKLLIKLVPVCFKSSDFAYIGLFFNPKKLGS